MPNQRELAQQLGLSQSTVSLALRDSPRLAPATRIRIQAAARKLGYHPNPMVSSLMAHIRSARPITEAGCIAVLVDLPDHEQWFNFHFAYQQQYKAIQRRAEQRGYRSECFFLRAPGMSSAAVDRILHARGIAGVILAGPRTECPALEMRWERYSWIKAGYTWEQPRMDCVSSDHRQNVELAFLALENRGRQKVGFCISRRMIPRANSNWVAGYLIAQRRLSPSRRIPMFITDPNPAGQIRFSQWLNKWRPDAIIGGNTEWNWLQKIKGTVPEFCWRTHSPGELGLSIEENNAIIGETLCDLLIEKIIHNERGLPLHPRLILIEGSFCNAGKPIAI